MALIEAGAAKPKPTVIHATEDKGLGILTWKSYLPLIVIGLILLAASITVSWSNGFSLNSFVYAFMTGFFLTFAGFKLMDLKGFAEGYSTYDLLAQKWFGYGYVYPFIELAFGLLMLAGFHSTGLLWTEFGVMAFSGLGVAIKLARKEPFICACLGTFLKIPLTKVTLIEDFGMAALALISLSLLWLK
ncbi:MAG: hypothetical protein JST90_07115 [Bacteroidetes bacterium]|nr:hypothetical protein [Bacteroidota bacterium]